MDDSDRVLERADSLMQRHRADAKAVTGDAGPGHIDEDLPLLTDIVAAEAGASSIEPTVLPSPQPALEAPEAKIAPDRIEARARELLFDRLPGQRQALAEELAAWLDDELPQLVLRILDGVTDQLIEQVTAEAKAVLLPRLQIALEGESQPPRHAD